VRWPRKWVAKVTTKFSVFMSKARAYPSEAPISTSLVRVGFAIKYKTRLKLSTTFLLVVVVDTI
jgi:hypothetical protein